MAPGPSRSRPFGLAGIAIVAAMLGLGVRWVTSGGMVARQKPSGIEAFVGRHLVDLGIPRGARERRMPPAVSAGSASSGDVAAGRGLYQQHCQACHGDDGRGKTEAGGGLYPPPISLDAQALAQRKRTDGEIFYLIQNGVRNTGMPGWQLPDEQIWQVVAFIRQLPSTVPATATKASHDEPVTRGATYVGSGACKSCHADLYARWDKTLMANVVRDPREHPDAILPDLTKPDPLVTFALGDIAFVYGSKWKQRYFKRKGDDYYPLPAQWDVTHKKWKPYFVKDDWWAPLYPPDNSERPTSALCDGCHSVNYDIKTHTVTEWNVGCERCHGPGSEHVKQSWSGHIVNPSRLGYVAANDICVSCHSQGRPRENPIGGRAYDWPVGYDATGKLSDVWTLEEHRLGETTFTHFADGTAHKNRMQGNDFVTSQMYTHGVTCFTCHDAHGTGEDALLRKPADALCLDCHGPNSPNGPRAPTLAAHTHHDPKSAGSQCVGCHMPKIAQTIGDVNVRSHTFRFVTPKESDTLKVPNACTACHADKPNDWATEALRSWNDRSPWRMGI